MTASRIAELEAALKPFAEQSRKFDEAAKKMGFIPRSDEYVPVTKFTHGDLRRARAALSAPAAPESAGAGTAVYRFLDVGDLIEAGDECPSDNCERWEPVNRWAIGSPRSAIFKIIRRQVAPSPPPAALGVEDPYCWVRESGGTFDPQNGGEPPSVEFWDKPERGAFALYTTPPAPTDALKVAVEALEYYASAEAWTAKQVEGPDGDYGNRARSALAAIRAKEEGHG